MKDKINVIIRKIIKEKLSGVLSAQGFNLENYPRCLPIDYCLDKYGDLILRVEQLSPYKKNIDFDNQVSLIVSNYDPSLQSNVQIKVLGNIGSCENQKEAADWYHTIFCDSSAVRAGSYGYLYYRINVNKVVYSNSLGKVCSINREQFLLEQIFTIDQIYEACNYMNQEHQDALKHYCEGVGLLPLEDVKIKVICFDKEGIWVLYDENNHFIPFTSTISNLAMLRAVLIAIAKQSGLLQYQEYY